MKKAPRSPVAPRAVLGAKARSISLRLKLMVYFLVILGLPLVTLGIIGPTLYAAAIERESTAHTVRMIGQVNMNVELRVLEMEKLIDLVARTGAVAAFLEAGDASAPARLGIRETIAAVVATHPEIAGLLVATERGAWESEGFSRTTRDSLTEERWYAEARAAPGQVRLVARPIGRNIRSTRRYGADEVVSIVKAVTGERDGSVHGAVLVDLKLSSIEGLFRDASLGKADFLFIADARGEIVYAPVNEIVYRVPLGPLEDGARSDLVRVGGADYQVLARGSSYTGWRTVGVFSLAETLREVRLVEYWTFLIGGLTMLLAIVLAFFFMSSVAKPVLRLRGLMKRVEQGDLAVRFAGRGGDEIAELGLGFDEMIERIQGLIDQVYSEQRSKREAELRILQEQIKPHFLYNTLDTIQWMAQEHRVDDVVCMVGALTSLFRIGLSKGAELIPLPDELEHVESYLCIQKMRYEDKFDYSVSVEEGLRGFRVMRLILQPLVENAIYHGIKERRGSGSLAVEGRLERRPDGLGPDLVLVVRDDGIGMGEDLAARLNASLEGGGDYPGGYGIRNVHERIRLTFGRPYGLSFRSAPGEGTAATIRHPILGAED
jgi:two-component system sensor histidine kinase YesM